jgi:Tfp pilus assembly protein FimT
MKSFTVFELIMVIIVIGVLLLIAIPNIDSYFDAKLNSCAQKIASDIRYAQYLSIAEHKIYGVQFNAGANYYRVYEPASGNTAQDPYTRMSMELDLDDSAEYKGVDITSVDIDSSNEVRFSTLGKPLNSTGSDLNNIGQINLSCRGRTKQILIHPITGWVDIQ